MDRTLVQSTNLSATIVGPKYGQFQGSRNKRRAVKMTCNVQSIRAQSLRLSSFSGLRPSNALDTLALSDSDFHSRVAASISVAHRRAGRCIAKAMFKRFVEKAVKVIMLVQDEVRRLGHNFVGTEQVFLGLIGEGTGISAKVLKAMQINLKDARLEVEKIIGRGSGFVAVEIPPFTPRAKRVLELSIEEARLLGNLGISLLPQAVDLSGFDCEKLVL